MLELNLLSMSSSPLSGLVYMGHVCVATQPTGD